MEPSIESLSKLLLGAWLDDTIINSYVHLLQEQAAKPKPFSLRRDCCLNINCFLYCTRI